VNRAMGCLITLVVSWLLLLAVAMGLIELAELVAGFLLWLLGG
jgi:hypothetical protein